jgi:hypothetical protein
MVKSYTSARRVALTILGKIPIKIFAELNKLRR